jgi:AAA domain
VRCGLHAGVDEARDNDFYGREVNRAARIMSAAHGGQVLVSEVVAQALADGLPRGVQLLDLGLVRLRDLPRAERVFQVQADGLRQQFPALAALAATPHNLPQRLNRFIGRADALARLRDLLASHRLVTLWGPGGIGKSRLSVELGHAVLDDFADGVWLVELAPLTDADRVAQAVAAVLGVKESTGQRLDEALADHVRDRRMLLILDNCEHVHGAAAELAKQLLGQGAGLRVLASSREVLRVAGEQAFAVPALSTPAAGQALDADQLMRHDAVRLFVDRASAALNRFQVDAANAPAVAEICGRLDGLPLAIELVAARVRSLPVAAIAERLRASFALVATHDATVAPRQRTLQLLIDWSHDLLSPAERMLYRRPGRHWTPIS